MLTGILTALAVILGYFVAVAISLIATFGITSAMPGFVAEEFRVTGQYKLLHEFIWLVCSGVAGFVACYITKSLDPLVTAILLSATLIGILWMNTWEMRQRGMAHQILISLASVAGAVCWVQPRDAVDTPLPPPRYLGVNVLLCWSCGVSVSVKY